MKTAVIEGKLRLKYKSILFISRKWTPFALACCIAALPLDEAAAQANVQAGQAVQAAQAAAQAESAAHMQAITEAVEKAQAEAKDMSNGAPVAQEPAAPAAAAQTIDAPMVTLRSTVRRTFVDVVVRDRKGHPVHGLTRDDFMVYEDGLLQPLRAFDVHNLKPAPGRQPDLKLDLPPNTFANLVRTRDDVPVTVILYDVLNTPPDALVYAHQAMVKFIKKQSAGTRIAIFVLGDQLRLLQGFTDDETRLMNAAGSKSAATQQSRQLTTSSATSDANAALAAELATQNDPAGLGGITTVSAIDSMKSMESTEQTFFQQQRLQLTVDAFAQIARFVSAVPGRKSLIWLSGSFPSSVLPNTDPTATGTANEFGDSYQFGAQVKQAEDLLTLNHVAVYPVDVRGLQVNPQFSASNNVKITNATRPNTNFGDQQAAEHSTMNSVAESTGGRAFYNTNGLDEAMQSALEESADYYTLTYAPSNAKLDGTQRKIVVKLRQPGYELAYRNSYFADDAAHPLKLAATPAADPNRNVFMDAGMQHGAPISSELFFESAVSPIGSPMPASPKEMDELTKFMAVKTRGRKKLPVSTEPIEVQHYVIDYVILGRQLELPPTADGRYRTEMTFALAAYTPQSEILNGVEVSIKNNIPAAQFQKIKTQGYHASVTFAAPVAASALRIAARDGIGNHMGSIEVPLPQVAPKPVATAPPVAPATLKP